MDVFVLVMVAVAAGWVGYLIGGSRSDTGAQQQAPSGPPSVNSEGADELYAVATTVSGFFNASAHPSDLLGNPDFARGVSLLSSWPVETLLGYYTGDNAIIACMALEALAGRQGEPDVRDRILNGINDYVPWTRFFALRVLDAHTPDDESIVGRLLATLDGSWSFPPNARFLGEFLSRRAERGERLMLGEHANDLKDEVADVLAGILDRMTDGGADGLTEELNHWRATRIDLEFLDSIGRVWEPGDEDGKSPILVHEALEADVSRIEEAILREPRRSVLMVGEHGVGKTIAARMFARRLAGKGWVVFEAGHNELIAGQVYIGQLEERLRELLKRINRRPLVWFAPDFHSLALSGRHRYGPSSVLDYVLPYVEKGDIVLLGETHPAGYDRLVQSTPRVLTAMETCRIAPLPEAETLRLVDRWADRHGSGDGAAAVDTETRGEAWLLAQQYLGDRAAPGNMLQLLDLTRMRLLAGTPDGTPRIRVDDLIATLSHLTGLPATILDERQGLDLAALRELFERNVLGQREAVDSLVECVAMIKAGVTDPTRPPGVFLFAGPTGTGKTEIAKTLTSFLFGSPDRMIRLDMSEFQDPESLNRIIGESPDERNEPGGALVDRIRRQPFSVILLDEFEKSHSNVWDLFLQVFDDGRLTDRRGNTADFRNAIVIMTSNLGSLMPGGAGLGFVDATGGFSAAAVMRTVERTFRKEFLNRLDRTVVFRPLTRETMREILRKELTEAFRRRGLRNRTWAVEFDESAIEYLLERGFTADLGARPLKRAIDRHLLAPLSMTIVNHQYPEGDQFLFVRSDGGNLVVDFVDPDAPEAAPAEVAHAIEALPEEAAIPLGRIALAPRGRAEEIAVLRNVYDRLNETVEDASWKASKHEGLEKTHAPGFWGSPGRFKVLGHVEYLDRIEAGLGSAGSLLERLQGVSGRPRERYPRDLVGRLAQQLYLLDAACGGVLRGEPPEAFVQVEAWSDTGTPSSRADAFARKVGAMYRSWSDRRRMQCETLEEAGGDGREPYRLLLSVSGYAAFAILQPEQGVHVMETPEVEGKGFRRVAARVRVVPQPDAPPASDTGGAARQAHDVLADHGAEAVAVVRRYREDPSPLVRDIVRGWRTGKLDRVLLGDFDLLGQISEDPTRAAS